MAQYRTIDMTKWPRAAHYRHFTDYPCAVGLQDEVDVTALRAACRASRVPFTGAVLWTVSCVVNRHEEFRLTEADAPDLPEPVPAVWDEVHPVYNIFHEETETYTSLFTLWTPDFGGFLSRMREDCDRAARLNTVSVPSPPNVFETSSVPWRHFTAASAVTPIPSLSPVIVWGGWREAGGRVTMPLSVTVSHAAADGFHLSRFLNECEEGFAALAKRIGGGIL